METIPTTQDALLEFMQNASTRFTADFADYGLSEEDATGFAALLTAANSARAAVEAVRADSEAATIALTQAVEALVASFRFIAAGLRLDTDISDETLATVGVFRRQDASTNSPPADPPVLSIVRIDPGSVLLDLRQVGGSRSRPVGCIGATLSVVDGAAAPVEGEQEEGQKLFVSRMRTRLNTNFGHARVRIYAQYLTRTGGVSPYSVPVALSPIPIA